MSKVLVSEANLTAIGDAIRYKNSSTTKYKPSEMANAIRNIAGSSGGSSGDSIKFLNFVELKNQYIDTGITPEPEYLYSYSFDASTQTDYYALFGCRKGDGYSKVFGILQTPNAAKIRLDFDNTDVDGDSTKVTVGASITYHPIYRFYGNGTTIYATTLAGSYELPKKVLKLQLLPGSLHLFTWGPIIGRTRTPLFSRIQTLKYTHLKLPTVIHLLATLSPPLAMVKMACTKL